MKLIHKLNKKEEKIKELKKQIEENPEKSKLKEVSLKVQKIVSGLKQKGEIDLKSIGQELISLQKLVD